MLFGLSLVTASRTGLALQRYAERCWGVFHKVTDQQGDTNAAFLMSSESLGKRVFSNF